MEDILEIDFSLPPLYVSSYGIEYRVLFNSPANSLHYSLVAHKLGLFQVFIGTIFEVAFFGTWIMA
jgi:hypothetical protein